MKIVKVYIDFVGWSLEALGELAIFKANHFLIW